MKHLTLTRILIAILIIIYLFLFLVVYTNERWSDGDEVHYLAVTSSIMKDFDLVLDNNYENKDYFAHHSHEESPHAYPGRHGELRPQHGILPSIIMVPAYWLSTFCKDTLGLFESNRAFLFFPRLTMLFIHIIFSFVLINFLKTLGFDKNISILCVILYLIQLPIVIYSQAIYCDLLASYFIMTGVYGIILFTKYHNYKWLIMSGIFWGASIFLHSKLIALTSLFILSSFVFLHFYLRKNKTFKIKYWFTSEYYRKIIYSLLVPWLIFLIGNIIMKFYWSGFFYIDGTHNQASRGGFLALIRNPLRGILGQWLDIEMGLIPNAPLLALIFAGLFIWFKKQKSSFLFIVPPIFTYLIMCSSNNYWSGGFCPPARHLLISIPILLPALCWILWSARKIVWLRWIVGILTFLSLVLSSLIPFVGWMGLPYSKGYNIYWRTILNFLRLDFLEPYISLNFLKPKTYYYYIGLGIFILLLGLGFYLQRKITKTEELEEVHS